MDRRRVYATGMSNGGMMCYRLAAELSDRIAAIAPVGGTLSIDDGRSEAARAGDPLPRHGRHASSPTTARTNEAAEVPEVQVGRRNDCIWAKLDGCPGSRRSQKLPDIGPRRHEREPRRPTGRARHGAEVVLWIIEGGGHTWPGRDPIVKFLGKSTRQISANDLIWEFFQKHPLP